MRKRHKYEYKIDVNSCSAPAAVVRMVGNGKRVLEIGAGPGSIARVLKGQNGCHVTAIEIDDEAIKKLSPFCERVYRSDLNNQAWMADLAQDSRFEVVVAADVLEHLRDPRAVLRTVRNLLYMDGALVVSLPHVGHNVVIGCLSKKDFEYQDWGLLDKTHVQSFDIENMQRLFNDTGFKIIDTQFIVMRPEQTELAYLWRRVPAELKKKLMSNRFGMVYQVVVKAKPDSSTDQGLVLSSLPIPAPESATPRNATFGAKVLFTIKKNVFPYLHPRTRFKLRNFLYRIRIRF